MEMDSVSPLDLALFTPERSTRTTRTLVWMTWSFVGIGVVLRLLRFAMNFPLWGDEGFVAVNFIDRGYWALLKPLEYGQICPLLFLWIERAAVQVFGFHERSLRLDSLICGVASLFLFRHVASRVIQGVPLLLAVGILAVSSQPIQHAAEVKPYASDLFAALIVLAPAVEWWRAPDRSGGLWWLAAVVPLALAMSHPAVFVASGVALGLAWPVWKARRWRVLLPFALFLIALVGSFSALYFTFTRGQSQVLHAQGWQQYWASGFPPLNDPVRFAVWLIDVHTGNMFAYPWGGPHGSSGLTTACVLVAAVFLWRSGRKALLVMLLGPFAMTLIAAALRRYPYGGYARQMQFVVPNLCLMAGLGASVLLQRFARPRFRPALAAVLVLLLLLTGLDRAARDCLYPYRFLSDQQARDFARRFWPSLEHDAELACVRWDFQVVNRNSLNLRTALYLCNQKIYSPQRQRGLGPRWDRVSAEHPARCVLYHDTPPDNPAVVAWMRRMLASYDVRKIERFVVDMSGVKAGPRTEQWFVLEFVPKPRGPGRSDAAVSVVPSPWSSRR